MEIPIDAGLLRFFYNLLVDLYSKSEDPITLGYSEGMLQVCAEKPFIDIYNFIPFPHLLHKATILMDSIINFHPFADGNKRIALVSTYFYLFWNGYDFLIPEDADEFTILVADNKKSVNEIFLWLKKNSIRSFGSVFRQKVCYTTMFLTGVSPRLADFLDAITTPFFFTTYPFRYLHYVMAKKKWKKEHPNNSINTHNAN